MIWDYLVESGHMNPFFVDWYTSTGVKIFEGLLVFTVVLFVVLVIPKGNTDPETQSYPKNAWLKIRWGALLMLMRKAKPQNKRDIILRFIFIIIASCLYYYVFHRIVESPDYLVVGSFQQLNETDLLTTINFLYRFAAVGIFLMLLQVIIWSTALLTQSGNEVTEQ